MNQRERGADAGPLKVFVIGESSGDPEKWSSHGTRAFVVAGSLEEAIGLVDFASYGAEPSLDRPMVFATEDHIGVGW